MAAWSYKKQEFVWEREWSTAADYDYFPYLANDVLLGRNFALDSQTGHELWRLTEADARISNILVSNGIAYFLAQGGQLRALNARTGQLLASIQFELTMPPSEPTISTFNVASSVNKVVVYLGDGYQLFAFQFIP